MKNAPKLNNINQIITGYGRKKVVVEISLEFQEEIAKKSEVSERTIWAFERYLKKNSKMFCVKVIHPLTF